MSPHALATAPPEETAHEGPFIITVHGGKGGIGKTTIAEHLAWMFAPYGDTLLVDADTGQQSAMDVYTRYATDVRHDAAVENDPSTLANVRAVPHKYVIIDGPPSAAEAEAAIEVADLIVIPMVPRIMDTRAIMKTIAAHLGGHTYRVVLNRVSTNMGASRVSAVQQALIGQGVPLLDTVIREYLGPHEQARMRGLPVTHPDLAPQDNGRTGGTTAERAAYDMRAMWREIAPLAGVKL